MIVVWISEDSISSTNFFECDTELSSTSVRIMNLFYETALFACSVVWLERYVFISVKDYWKPVIKVVPPPACTVFRVADTFSMLIADTLCSGISVLALLLNTTSPKASFGLIFDKNIIIAYFANSNLFPRPFEVSGPPIDPEISRTITALRTLSSLSSPSLDPFVKTVRKLLISLSKKL